MELCLSAACFSHPKALAPPSIIVKDALIRCLGHAHSSSPVSVSSEQLVKRHGAPSAEDQERVDVLLSQGVTATQQPDRIIHLSEVQKCGTSWWDLAGEAGYKWSVHRLRMRSKSSPGSSAGQNTAFPWHLLVTCFIDTNHCEKKKKTFNVIICWAYSRICPLN